VEGGLELGESLPFFVHPGVAGIVDAAKIEDIAAFRFGLLDGGPGEEGGGKGMIAGVSCKSCVVSSNSLVVEDEERAHELIAAIAEVKITSFTVGFDHSIEE